MIYTAARWSGLLLIVGAVLLGVATEIRVTAVTTSFANQPLPPLANTLLFLSSALLLLSLPAMYARQADAAGWLGLVGHALLQTGILLFVVLSAPPLLYPSFDRSFEISLTAGLLGVALALGLLMTSIATLRAGVFPRWAGILLLTGTAGFFFGFFIGAFPAHLVGQVAGVIMGISLGLALAWIGFSMWRSPQPAT